LASTPGAPTPVFGSPRGLATLRPLGSFARAVPRAKRLKGRKVAQASAPGRMLNSSAGVVPSTSPISVSVVNRMALALPVFRIER